MKLPHAERAVVNPAKLRDYSLNPAHEVGKHKARVFRSALGLTMKDAEWLRARILQAAVEEDATRQPSSPFGENYIVDFSVERGGSRATVRTSWIVEYGTGFPRLTSCYVI